jgi:hypothetical protein
MPKFFDIGDLSPPPHWRRRGGRIELFSPWRLLKMMRQLRHHQLHRYDDMETFISGRQHQGGDDVTAIE